jgi:type I restriction enzyme M protein
MGHVEPHEISSRLEDAYAHHADNRHERQATWSETNLQGRWRSYSYADIIKRDKCSLHIFWLRDESLEDSDNLPDPDVIAAEIVEDLKAALEQFAEIQADLSKQ